MINDARTCARFCTVSLPSSSVDDIVQLTKFLDTSNRRKNWLAHLGTGGSPPFSAGALPPEFIHGSRRTLLFWLFLFTRGVKFFPSLSLSFYGKECRNGAWLASLMIPAVPPGCVRKSTAALALAPAPAQVAALPPALEMDSTALRPISGDEHLVVAGSDSDEDQELSFKGSRSRQRTSSSPPAQIAASSVAGPVPSPHLAASDPSALAVGTLVNVYLRKHKGWFAGRVVEVWRLIDGTSHRVLFEDEDVLWIDFSSERFEVRLMIMNFIIMTTLNLKMTVLLLLLCILLFELYSITDNFIIAPREHCSISSYRVCLLVSIRKEGTEYDVSVSRQGGSRHVSRSDLIEHSSRQVLRPYD